MTSVHKPPENPGYPEYPEYPSEVRVPKFVGLMAVDARGLAAAHGVRLTAPDRPGLAPTTVDYVVRQYPLPGVEVPRDAAVTVWFDLGEGEAGGGAGVRVPREPGPRGGGMRRELNEPDESVESAECAGPFSRCP
ncbi:PASTA domain-containing protein [Streptomyces sp. NPDC016845]|uniref:PASTA domain-containing protein n=1 Tax=Streptomyces sp. NPDC016845 TaxID=3364972 RepID=UPI0037B6E985